MIKRAFAPENPSISRFPTLSLFEKARGPTFPIHSRTKSEKQMGHEKLLRSSPGSTRKPQDDLGIDAVEGHTPGKTKHKGLFGTPIRARTFLDGWLLKVSHLPKKARGI